MTAGRRTVFIELATVAGFCAFLFLFGLNSFGLLGADEPRYAQIGREMMERGDPVTPVLHGEAWLEKPPLYYWGAMASFAALGVSDFTARLPVGLMAAGMVFFVYSFVRRFHPGAQLDAALITASAAAVLGFARGASTDMPLSAAFVSAMLAWYGWYQTRRRVWLLAFYALLGLSVLAKGPVGPGLAGLVILPFLGLRRQAEPVLAAVKGTLWLPGILLFFAVALPWYVAVQLANPEFFRIFILEHNLLRYSTQLYRHIQPFWYYLPVLLLSLAPWTVLALAALAEPVRRWRAERHSAPPTATEAFDLFLLLWAVIPVVFFSLSQSKLPGYILPAIPAYTVLLALHLRRRLDERPGALLLALHGVVAGLVLAAALLSPYVAARVSPPRGAIVLASVIGLALAVGVYATLSRQGLRLARFVTLVPVIIGVAFILRAASPALDVTQSARPLAQHLAEMGTEKAEVPVALFQVSRHLEYGLGWYRNRATPRYERGETPQHDHLVVTRTGAREALQAEVPERRVSPLGEFPARRVELFWVSGPAEHEGHEHGPGEHEHQH